MLPFKMTLKSSGFFLKTKILVNLVRKRTSKSKPSSQVFTKILKKWKNRSSPMKIMISRQNNFGINQSSTTMEVPPVTIFLLLINGGDPWKLSVDGIFVIRGNPDIDFGSLCTAHVL